VHHTHPWWLVWKVPPWRNLLKTNKKLLNGKHVIKTFICIAMHVLDYTLWCNCFEYFHLWKCRILVEPHPLRLMHRLWLNIFRTWEGCCKIDLNLFKPKFLFLIVCLLEILFHPNFKYVMHSNCVDCTKCDFLLLLSRQLQ
jgi:hypothetical protein